jgi:hypothetical protein
MNEGILFFTGIVAVCAVIVVVEWRYRLRSLRVGAILLAGAMLWFFQPSTHAAWRRAMSTPPSERVTHAGGFGSDSLGPLLSEYQSGVYTMYEAVADDVASYANERLLALCVLFWLAFSPVLRPASEASRRVQTPPDSGAGTPEA